MILIWVDCEVLGVYGGEGLDVGLMGLYAM